MVMNKPICSTEAGLGPAASNTTKILAKHVALLEFVTCRRYDDGSEREPGYFTVGVSQGQWRLVLKDPTTCTQLVVLAEKIDDAFQLADMLLGDPMTPWIEDPWLLNKKPRKRR